MRPFNLEEYLKKPEMKVVTRDGRNVTIHCTNYDSNFPIIAEIEGTHSSDSFNKEGKFYQISNSENDLFFAPKKHEGWINIYKRNNETYRVNGIVYKSKTEANAYKDNDHIATLKIEWEE